MRSVYFSVFNLFCCPCDYFSYLILLFALSDFPFNKPPVENYCECSWWKSDLLKQRSKPWRCTNMVPFIKTPAEFIQIMFLILLNRHGPFCVIKTCIKPLPSWAALVNLFVLKVLQNIAVAIAVCFHSLLLSLGSTEDLSHEKLWGLR